MPFIGGLYLANPWALMLLTLPVAYLAWYFLILPPRRLRLTLSYDPAELLRQPKAWQMLRLLPPLLAAGALVCWAIALARPQETLSRTEQTAKGIDILLLLDVSASMQTTDLPPNRLEVAKQVATEFVDGRQQDRIGIVLFGQQAFSYAPLTQDYAYLKRLIADLSGLVLNQQGTALGDAIGVGINRLAGSPRASQVMVLLTDGANRGGSLDPRSAAKLAAERGIRIHTIAIGTQSYSYQGQDGANRIATPDLNEPTLRSVASLTGGLFFRSMDAGSLQRIFRQISALEQTEIRTTVTEVAEDVYFPFVLCGLLCAVAHLGLLFFGWANLLEE